MIDGREKNFLQNDDNKRKLINAAGTDKDHKGMDAVVVYDHSWGDVEVSGLGNLFNNRLTKILTDKGAALSSVLRFDYDPKSYLNDVLSLKIHRKEGGVETLDVAQFSNVRQPESMLYWRVWMKLFNLPTLRPGDAVEWETFKKGFNVAYLTSPDLAVGSAGSDKDQWVDPKTGIKPPMYGAFYDIVYFRERIPIKDKRYTILAPRSMPLSYEFYNGDCSSSCTIDKDYFTYTWQKKDIDGYKPEKRMPGIQTALPKLLISSIHDWREKSRWFQRVNETQFEWNEDIKQLVDRITAPFQTDEEKVKALLHWAANEIRYIGFSICQGEGYTLHPGIMTFKERGGVCKDYAGVLVTLLRAAGYESYAAQTQAINPVNRIPADQFDHCVTAWRKPDGTWQMLDPTWAPYSMEVWDAAETLQNYLIGSPEGEDLGVTKLFTPEESLLTITGHSTLKDNGALDGSFTFWGKGRSDSSQRFRLAWAPAVNAERAYQKLIGELDPAATILESTTTEIRNVYENYRTTLSYHVPDYALTSRDQILFQLPLLKLMRHPSLIPYLTATEEESRAFDLLVVFLQLANVDEEITIPAGYRLLSKPFDLELKNDAVEFAASLQEHDDRLHFHARFCVKVRKVGKGNYKEFKEITDKAKALSERWFTLGRNDSHCN